MFVVYWCETKEDGTLIPFIKEFPADQMSLALEFSSALRNIPEDEPNAARFVNMASENPNSVGKRGVDVVDSTYSWTKRRNNMPSLKRN